jgi:hypothetical protein
MKEYESLMEEKHGKYIIHHLIESADFAYPKAEFDGESYKIAARKAREGVLKHSEIIGFISKIPLEEVNTEYLNEKNEKVVKEIIRYEPVIFEEKYYKNVELFKVEMIDFLEADGKIPSFILNGSPPVNSD